MSNQQLATRATSMTPANRERRIDIRAELQKDSTEQQIAAALPEGYSARHFIRTAITQINLTPKLAECTPTSILLSVAKGAAMGIECDGRNGHLVPRWNSKKGYYEAQFQADYKGLIGLVRKNPNVTDVYAVLVRKNDDFKVVQGLHRDLVHNFDFRKERGEIIGAYGVVSYKDGTTSFEVMNLEEIYSIRNRSESWQAYLAKRISTTPWKDDEGEMCKKTVLRRLFKMADLSPETRERLAHDTEPGTETPTIPVNLEVPELPAADPESTELPEIKSLPAGDEPQPEPAADKAPFVETPEPDRTAQRTRRTQRAPQPAPTPEPYSEEPAPEAEVPEVIPPETAGASNPAPWEESATPTVASSSWKGKLMAKIKAEKMNEKEFTEYLISKKFLKPGETLELLNEEKSKIIFEAWAGKQN